MVKLDKNSIENIFALTPMQEGMLFHYLKESQNRYYFEQLSLVTVGDIDLACFEKAWNVVIETNEMLRTVFRWEKLDHPVQVILKKHQLQWHFRDLSTIIDEANRNENEIERNMKSCLEEIKTKDRDQSFDLQKVPFRITLCKIGKNRYEMIISNHHILYDGWSNGIILKEFFNAYDDLSNGKECVKPVKTKFKEFITWNRNQGVNIDKQEKFWRNYLKGVGSQTGLSIKRSKANRKNTPGKENFKVNFKKELKDKIENFVRNHRITLASFLYSVWGLLLQKYNNSYQAVFGTTVSGRSVKIDKIGDMVGLFINTIPLLIKTNPGEKIGDLLHRIDNTLQVREEYEQTSLVDIRKYSEIDSREELFDSIVILENYPLERRLNHENNQLSVDSYSMVERTHYNLTVTVTIFDGIGVNIAFNETLFEEGSIARLTEHFQCIAQEIVKDTGKQVSYLEGITEEEKKQVLYEFNDTAADYPVDKTLHWLLEEHVERTPDRVALIGENPKFEIRNSKALCEGELLEGTRGLAPLSDFVSITYHELNKKSNLMAYFLRDKGVKSDTILGIKVERSIEMVVGILGILKAGGAYLPIEPGYPQERIDYMLSDSSAKFLVTTPGLSKKFEKLLIVNNQLSIVNCQREKPPSSLLHLEPAPATSLAYVLYTSGSTGKPKGVMVEHGPVVNILTALQREYPLTESDVFLLKTPYVFDISVTELFGWFWEGGRLAVLEKDGEKDPEKILTVIEKIGITHINFVPSMFNIFVEALNSQNKGKLSGLKYILLCGEELLPGVIGRFAALNTKITVENIYGPTEAAIYASKYSLAQWENSGIIPIGKPLPNYKIYILDKDQHLQPIGVPGELCISGDGLARGYLNQTELTVEKFCHRRPGGRRMAHGALRRLPRKSFLLLPTPHSTNTPFHQYPIYRTGDLARWLWDGNIEFLGRMDLQVKIRGFRIELGEIENRLLDHPAVKEAVVIARDDRKGEKYLCAYLVYDEKGFNTRQVKEFLSTRLPDYMIPGYFVPLPGLPLTSSNKINRNALPEPLLKASQGCEPPRNQIEKKLIETWLEVLGRDRDGKGEQQPMIGIDDNFFELGGHSLKAMALMLKIHKEFNVKVSLQEFFKALTIRQLSHHIKNKTREKYVSIAPAPQKDYYVLSSAQMRLYLIQQLNQKSTGYNMSWAASLEGELDYNRLEEAFTRLINRHESLRTSFHMLAGQPVQKVHEKVEFEIEYDDMKEVEGEVKVETTRISSFIRPFDLSRAPLLRVGLRKKTRLYHFIIIDMHHIISDGTSMSILTREFVNLYKKEELPIPKLRYNDFSEWQNQRLGSGKLKQQEEYWLSHLAGELPILNMPFDHFRPIFQSFKGDQIHYQLEGQLTRDLKALAEETGATLYMVLLAAYNLLVRGYTGQEDIIIGTPIAGRTHADLGNVIGLFLETLTIRSYPRGEQCFNHFLEEIKNTTLKAYENQDYPFRELIKKKGDVNNLSRNPIFDVMLNVLNQDKTELKMEGVRVIPVDLESRSSKVDLTIEVMEVDDKIILHFEYCTALFSRNTIERLSQHFVNILGNLMNHPHIRISEIELLNAKEKLQIMEEFNTTFSEPIRNETVIEGFEKQVERTPDRVALIGKNSKFEIRNSNVSGGGTLLEGTRWLAPLSDFVAITYKELNKKSNLLAYLLMDKGVKPDVIVGIMVERSVEMIIGILGILKAGAAYMPIDPEYPEERINYMLADSGAQLLLTDNPLRHFNCQLSIVNCQLSSNEETPSAAVFSNPQPAAGNWQLAYVIYTSGSTGRPKGVLVNHKNLGSYLDSFEREFRITADDVVLQQASYSFDAFLEEVFPCLLKGGKIALPSQDQVRDTTLLVDFISTNKISMIDCSPLLLSELNKSCPVNAPDVPLVQNPLQTIHTFISGGDVLKREYIDNLIKTGVVYNTYGPTETTVCASYHKLCGEEQSNIPIGKPITNYRIYILNKDHKCLPIGVPGELCISGLGVTRGYLNRPELTAEKFIELEVEEDIYHKSYRSYTSYIIYKTGDLARHMTDGSIEFLGRIDRQVNIRGFRIELEEIERQMLTHEDIHETAITAIGTSSICAYFTARKEKNPKELRQYLSLKLPGYMIPAYFVQLDQLPLTQRGKINTRALPDPGKHRLNSSTGYKAPRSEKEKKIADIWQEILGLEGIGIEDDFFELGGDSLLANQCIARIREELEVELSLRKLFENPCIESLVKVFEPGEVGVPRVRPLPREGKIPLSFSQERLWFLQCLDPGSMAYYVPRVIRIKGEVEIELLERVITEIIRRHEILRTVFPTSDGEPVQYVLVPYVFQLPIIDFSGASEEEKGRKISQWLEEEGQRSFNFQQGPMMRITLLKVKEKEYILVLTEHHLIHDGWTQEVLLKEFINLFNAYSEGKPSPLAELPIQYADFAIWQRNHLKGEVLERHLDYWKNKMSGLAPVLELPTDRPRPPVPSGKGAMRDVRLSRELYDASRKFSKERGITLFMTMLAVFKVLVYRYTGCEDICVGTGAANRQHKELEGMLGMLINTLALRTFVPGDLSFETCLERVKTTCMEAYEHEDTPFGKVVEVIQPERSLSYSPIFQVIFSFMDIRGVELVLPGLELQAEVSHNRSSKFDINVVVIPPQERASGSEDEPGEILIEWEYNTDLFNADTIDRMIDHYNRLLEESIRRPTIPIAVLPMLAEEEIERLLYTFNDTRTGYPKQMSIHSLFELQVEKTPDYIALHGCRDAGSHGKSHITYGKLNDESDRLSHLLREKSLQPDTIVGMMMEHSIELIIGIMGILKAGGAYLPIDHGYPEERIKYMLKDSRAKILVTTAGLSEKFKKLLIINCQLLMVNEMPSNSRSSISNYQLTINNLQLEQANLAYIIYTSGTTGRPRGVGIEHPSLVNLCFWHNRYYHVTEADNAAKFAGISFDASVWEIFPYLIKGASLHIISEDIKLDIEKLSDYYEKQNITIGFLPTQYCEQFISMERTNRSLRVLLTGGDRLRVFRQQHYELYNNYGPTENTVVTTACLVEDGSRTIPIGKPIDNNNVYILSKNSLQLQPQGAGGELGIGGDSLARGYINNPELTWQKFQITGPQITQIRQDLKKVPGKRISHKCGYHRSYRSYRSYILYKTGDLARWLRDGNIEFLGRLDHQVKIRGFRIELGEIENRLLEYSSVKEAVVIDQVDADAGKYLSAYIVAHPEPEPSKLQEWLSMKLPSYMIPSFITPLDKIPLTPNGKIDRKALPAPVFKGSEHFTAPEDEIEKKLARIWSEVMGIEEELIPVEANFFELGGHSLKATLMTAKIHKVFNVKLPLAEVFKIPSIRGLAGYIKNSVQDRYRQVPPAEKKEYYIQSSAQQRLYFLQQMDMDSIVYNIPDIILLNESIDIEKLENTFKKLTARHESLRTSFHTVDDQPVQVVHDVVEFEIQYLATKDTEDTEGKNYNAPVQKKGWGRMTNYKQIINKKEITNSAQYSDPKSQQPRAKSFIYSFIRPFDLSREPLFRVGLRPGPSPILMLDIHHIICDGISMNLLRKELTTLYEDKELPDLRIQYKDYARWQNSKQQKEFTKKQEEYWLKKFNDQIPVLNLPGDYLRPVVQSYEGDRITFEIGKENRETLKKIARWQDTTLFMVLVAIFKVFLSKLTGQEDIIIGTPTAGRGHADLENIIGMFVNTLALRNYPMAGKSYPQFLEEVKIKTLEAFENQDYQFEDLVNHPGLDIRRDPGRNPLFDVMFAFQDMETPPDQFPFKSMPHESGTRTSKFDFTLNANEIGEKLHFTFEYCTRLFKKETINRFTRYFKNIVSVLVENHKINISDIEMVPQEEKEQILYEFNDTRVDYPKVRSIIELFEEQVKQRPHQVALLGRQINAFGQTYLTYRELNEKSNQLALLLKGKGMMADRIVVIMVERSVEMIIGLLGILKAGGAYLPIDSDYPQERVDYILADSNAIVLVTTSILAKESKKLRSLEVKRFHETIFIDTLEFSSLSSSPLLNFSTSPYSLAYIIYTSGTTGKPKGVMIQHQSLVNLCSWHNQYFQVKESDHATQYANISFDASVWEIFPYLIKGASLTIINPGIKLDIEKLNEFFETRDITISFLPTQLCEQFMQLENHSLRKLLTGGDRLNIFIKRNYKLHNNYGPTENTVVNTSFPVNRYHLNIPIGKPVDNNRIYILDKNGHFLQPIGIPGELCIAGDGLARGYLNNPELTAEKFCLRRPGGRFLKKLPPWIPRKNFLLKGSDKVHMQSCNHATMQLSPHHSPQSPIYQTGDLARWLADGNIEFLGRIDFQVKIRGFRIEPGEIENLLLEKEEINDVVVLANEDKKTGKSLCAYIVSGSQPEPEELREYLSRDLPGYMIPSFFVFIDKIPLTASGKIDRKALPKPEIKLEEDYVAPRDMIEKRLVEIWSEILGLAKKKISINSNFFRLGGHSLKALQLVSKAHKILQVKIPLDEIFKTPFIRGLASYVKKSAFDKYISIEPTEKKEYYVLSSALKRLYFLRQIDKQGAGTGYNMLSTYKLGSDVDKARFEYAFRGLIKMHESLRTSFEMLGREPVQKVHDEVEFNIEYYDKKEVEVKIEQERLEGTRGLAPLPEEPAHRNPQSATSLISTFIRPFDLSHAPLLRVGLIKLEENQHILMVDVHHIIADGTSQMIMANQFMSLYAGPGLPPLKLQYKDYCQWQKKNRGNENSALKKQQNYWVKQYEGDIPLLNLPVDYPRTQVQDFEGRTLLFAINKKTTAKINHMVSETGATLFMILLTALNILLAKYTKQEDIIVGSASVGRQHPDLGEVIGMFVNTLAIRNYPAGEKNIKEFLKEVKTNSLKAFENQDYPFEELVEKLGIDRSINRNPLFDIMLVLQNFDIPQANEGKNNIPTLEHFHVFEGKTSRFDLSIYAEEKEEKIAFIFEYSTKLFKQETIERLFRDFTRILEKITGNIDIKIKNIRLESKLATLKNVFPDVDFNM